MFEPWQLGLIDEAGYNGIRPEHIRRVGDELRRRNIDYQFGAKTFWLWNVLGSLILVGPFVFVHKLMKAMNRINGDFNRRG